MIRTATRTTTVTDVRMETRTAAQVVTETTAPLEKGHTTSTATTGTTGVIDPITTGELLKPDPSCFSCFNIFRLTNLRCSLKCYFSGIQTPKEDVMNSIPTTIREERALLRTSGGCPSTGQQVRLGWSTTVGPSIPTNLRRCWTLAHRRLRSLPRTRALQLSGPGS